MLNLIRPAMASVTFGQKFNEMKTVKGTPYREDDNGDLWEDRGGPVRVTNKSTGTRKGDGPPINASDDP